jgi:hypothetical protein
VFPEQPGIVIYDIPWIKTKPGTAGLLSSGSNLLGRKRTVELADTGGRWFLSGCYRKAEMQVLYH